MILIGMPAAGKSTIGVILAKTLHKDFIDTDLIIQHTECAPLQTILDEKGLDEFRKIEESHILKLTPQNTVIATGGSVPYSDVAMAHLKKNGIVIYIDLPLDVIESRLTNIATRGVVMHRSQTLANLYAERKPLYKKHADFTIDTTNLIHEQVVVAIIEKIINL
jgi:shikimate kinase